MLWVLLYLVIGLFIDAVTKSMEPEEYDEVWGEYPDLKPYVPIFTAILWLPTMVITIITTIFDIDLDNKEN